MKEEAIVKQLDGMSAKDRAAAEAMARRAGRHAMKVVKEKLGHLADPAMNIGEKLGGGALGWGVEVGVRYLVDKLGQPAPDGTQNTFGKHKDLWKGGLSLGISATALLTNAALPGSQESSTARRLGATAGVVTGLFAIDRLLKTQLGLPS